MFFADVDFNNLNLNNCIYDNNTCTFQAALTYNNNDLIIYTNKMCLANILPQDLQNNKFVLEANFTKTNNDFYIFMYNLDNKIIDLLFEKSMVLFNVQFKKENIIDLYKKYILLPNNLYECPKIKIQCNDNVIINNNDNVIINNNDNVIINNNDNVIINNNKYNINNLNENCEVDMKILFNGIIFEKNKCFLNCTILSINVLSNTIKQNKILFTDCEDTYSDIINYIKDI